MELPLKVSDFESLELALRKVLASSVHYNTALNEASCPTGTQSERCIRPAAVGVVFRGSQFELSEVLLTERSADLRTHAGQVAFPGGSLEPNDHGNLIHAALRELAEETGLPQSSITPLGLLPRLPTMSGGFEVTPVIGLFTGRSDVPFNLSKEVSFAEWVSVFELKKTYFEDERTLNGKKINCPNYWWGSRKVWGVSAWIFDLILRRYGTLGV